MRSHVQLMVNNIQMSIKRLSYSHVCLIEFNPCTCITFLWGESTCTWCQWHFELFHDCNELGMCFKCLYHSVHSSITIDHFKEEKWFFYSWYINYKEAMKNYSPLANYMRHQVNENLQKYQVNLILLCSWIFYGNKGS